MAPRFGRYGDTDCPKQNNQAEGSPKCHLPHSP